MLKRIRLDEVELGMFIHKLDGNWLDHPFWRSRFLLEDRRTLMELQASYVDGVIIDTSKGMDVRRSPEVARPVAAAAPAPAPAARTGSVFRRRAAAAPARPTVDLRSTAPTTSAREFGMASRVATSSMKFVSKAFFEARLGKAIKPHLVQPVIDDIFASVQRNPHTFNGLMRCRRDNDFLFRHALAVSALMISLARQMKMTPAEIRHAGMAGLLMDVGVGLLHIDLAEKSGDFRGLDPVIFQQHVRLGHDFLQSGGGIPGAVLRACLEHHERMDGSGFPFAKVGQDIGQLSRMAAICDTFDLLVSTGAEGDGLDPASALRQLNAMGPAFDQTILQHFIHTMGTYPIGSFVRLRSDRLAMVVDEDPSDHMRPKVRTFFSMTTQKRITGENIALAECFGEDEIVSTVELTGMALPQVAQLRESLFAAATKA